MMQLDPLGAAAPETNATVHASAGSGKTWLLVTRIIRLLLAGHNPGNIVALTFTRKAAAEMQNRLIERTRQLATGSEQHVKDSLQQMGLDGSAAWIERARELYEQLLHCRYPIRITTFHAFCQEILLRFPLEAEIPPEFELLETAALLQLEAWETLYQQAESSDDSVLAGALDYLFYRCGSLDTTAGLLQQFLAARIDWWAYTHGQADPQDFALRTLAKRLLFDADDTTTETTLIEEFLSPGFCLQLEQFARLVGRHPSGNEQRRMQAAHKALDNRLAPAQRLHACERALCKNDGMPMNISKALNKSIGVRDQALFESLLDALYSELQAFQQRLARHTTWHLSRAWIIAGSRLLSCFQTLKKQRRYLDFADLEWKTCKLLNHEDNALWVQYKLDQRIDHLLIDEFQDTNPTQWRMLLPLLEELAAGEQQRARSVFLVGDEKQSIYQFRRANPELFFKASDWLAQHLGARKASLAMSRRSSPAIIEAVNLLFDTEAGRQHMPAYERHTAFHTGLWGAVTLLPLLERPGTEEPTRFRNPLHEPRQDNRQLHFQNEARQIAETITGLVETGTRIEDQGRVRSVDYADILILVRKRTHVHHIEHALAEYGIPFLSADRGTLLECLEIRDLCCLLEILLSPYDNLKLAQVLRSPLYDATEDELLQLAAVDLEQDEHSGNSWYHRLQRLAPTLQADSSLSLAWQQLSHWRRLAGSLPVHDLLDRIYDEADIIDCYLRHFPPALGNRVSSNFARFIDLALNLDGGRFPSLMHFIQYIKILRSSTDDAPDVPPAGEQERRVSVMTIHAAKGLEAPVVFVADTTSTGARAAAYDVIVRWPADQERPTDFFVTQGRQRCIDWIERIREEREHNETRQEMNLLYVALTRARQYLYLSGTLPAAKGKQEAKGWYALVKNALQDRCETVDGSLVMRFGEPAPLSSTAEPAQAAEHQAVQATTGLDRLPAAPAAPPQPTLSPSATAETPTATAHTAETDDDAQVRGVTVHYMLELLSERPRLSQQELFNLVLRRPGLCQDTALLEHYHQEVTTVLQASALQRFFDSCRYDQAHNEIPVHFEYKGHKVTGIIDRIVVHGGTVSVIDYKTHQSAARQIETLCEKYRRQMQLYVQGVRRLWPEKKVEAVLLFTTIARAITLDE